jgi:hypothetical protein
MGWSDGSRMTLHMRLLSVSLNSASDFDIQEYSYEVLYYLVLCKKCMKISQT